MIVLEIDDKKLEEQIKNFITTQKKDLKEFTKEAFERFFEKFSSSDINYQKLDPNKHIKKIDYPDVEDLDADPYSKIKDSAEYVKKLRRKAL